VHRKKVAQEHMSFNIDIISLLANGTSDIALLLIEDSR